jgi:hypothetical protein
MSEEPAAALVARKKGGGVFPAHTPTRTLDRPEWQDWKTTVFKGEDIPALPEDDPVASLIRSRKK